jgi:hypothetical protein
VGGPDHDDILAGVDEAFRLDAEVRIDLAYPAKHAAVVVSARLHGVGRVHVLELGVNQMTG